LNTVGFSCTTALSFRLFLCGFLTTILCIALSDFSSFHKSAAIARLDRFFTSSSPEVSLSTPVPRNMGQVLPAARHCHFSLSYPNSFMLFGVHTHHQRSFSSGLHFSQQPAYVLFLQDLPDFCQAVLGGSLFRDLIFTFGCRQRLSFLFRCRLVGPRSSLLY